MKTIGYLLVFLLFCQCKQEVGIEEEVISGDEVLRLAIGSCNNQSRNQILWDEIVSDRPDAWIWLGDNIYGDSDDVEIMKEKYAQQKSHPEYEELQQVSSIYGIWDDHDYGLNDGGKEFQAKSEMRDLMLEFLDVPSDHEVWKREGAYQSYLIGNDQIEVKLILLDSRYFRDPSFKIMGGYDPNLEGSILGEEQWLWLEEELSSSTSDILLIGNGIQVIPEEHRFEKWANFPNERKKLLDLIDKYNHRTILLSGDRHLSEVSKIDLKRPLYEVTSSGMTHSYSNYTGEPNSHRINKVVTDKSYGLIRFVKDDGELTVIFQAKGDGGVTIMEQRLDE